MKRAEMSTSGFPRAFRGAGLLLCVIALVVSCAHAQTASTNELQEGRYVLVMMKGRAISNTRVPTMILDSYQGIVWTCQNLQDSNPLWVKVDLARNAGTIGRKRYVARMLEWQDADLRMPGIVLDVEEGIIWTCPNIIDGKAVWIRKDLRKETGEQAGDGGNE